MEIILNIATNIITVGVAKETLTGIITSGWTQYFTSWWRKHTRAAGFGRLLETCYTRSALQGYTACALGILTWSQGDNDGNPFPNAAT